MDLQNGEGAAVTTSTEEVPAREGRRERRARETRARILQAAIELFHLRGFDNVTVEEIADHADVARGTVFNHFPTKMSLCLGMGELQVGLLEEALADGRIRGDATEKIGQAMRLMGSFPGRSAERARELIVRSLGAMRPGEIPHHRQQVFAMFQRWVVEGQESGLLRRDFEACSLAAFFLGMQFQATLLWAWGFVPGTLEENIERVYRLGLDGARARPQGQ